MVHEIQHTAQQHNNNSSISEGYGMSQNHHFECPQATFDSCWATITPHSPSKSVTATATRLQQISARCVSSFSISQADCGAFSSSLLIVRHVRVLKWEHPKRVATYEVPQV